MKINQRRPRREGKKRNLENMTYEQRLTELRLFSQQEWGRAQSFPNWQATGGCWWALNCSAAVLMSLQPSTLAARFVCPADGGRLSDPDSAFWVILAGSDQCFWTVWRWMHCLKYRNAHPFLGACCVTLATTLHLISLRVAAYILSKLISLKGHRNLLI